MTQHEPVSGAESLARSLAVNGTTHVFFIDAVLRRHLIELGILGVHRVLGHSEKAFAYMAVGLRDAYLGRAPVRVMTGYKHSSMQYRNAYQEIRRAPLFAAEAPHHATTTGSHYRRTLVYCCKTIGWVLSAVPRRQCRR